MHKNKSLRLTLFIPIGRDESMTQSLSSDSPTLFQQRKQGQLNGSRLWTHCPNFTAGGMRNSTIKSGKENVAPLARVHTNTCPGISVHIPMYTHTGSMKKRDKLRGHICAVCDILVLHIPAVPRSLEASHPASPPMELVIRIAIQIHLSGLFAVQFYYCFMKL